MISCHAAEAECDAILVSQALWQTRRIPLLFGDGYILGVGAELSGPAPGAPPRLWPEVADLLLHRLNLLGAS